MTSLFTFSVCFRIDPLHDLLPAICQVILPPLSQLIRDPFHQIHLRTRARRGKPSRGLLQRTRLDRIKD